MHVAQRLDTSFAEARLQQPTCAFRAGILATANRFDQHVQARKQPVGFNTSVIVDERIIHNECAAWWQGLIGLLQQQFFGWKIPIVQDASHDKNIGSWQRDGKENAAKEGPSASKGINGTITEE